MKIIDNDAVFEWNPLPEPSYFRGMEFYHCRSRRSYRMLATPAGDADDLLHIESYCEVALLKNAHYMRRNAPFLSLEYVKSGSLYVRQRGLVCELGAGDMFVMQPMLKNEFVAGGDGCDKISVMVVGSLLEAFLKQSKLCDIDVASNLDRIYTERLFMEVAALSSFQHNGMNSQLTFELLQSLRISARHTEAPAKLQALCDELANHPEYPWTQPLMAGRCNCSPTHLNRLFHEHYATSPWQYLLDIRMNQAKHLLANENLSIKEISTKTGYDDPLNFSTAFRKKFSVSPRQYRRELSFLLNA